MTTGSKRATMYVYRARRDREGWTRVRGPARAETEAGAWRSAGWTCVVRPSTPEVRAAVRKWERQAKGYPGEATSRGSR